MVPRRSEQSPVDISSTKVTPHLSATCNANTYNHTHSSTYTLMYLNVYMSRMQYTPHDSNPESSLTPSYLHITSVKNCQGRPALDPFPKTKAFCFVILDTLYTPNAYLFPYQVLCVIYTFMGHGFSGSHHRMSQVYTTFFYGLSLTVSCLNHIPGFLPEGVSIPTCFTHLHTYFSCHAIVSLNLDVVQFY